jgi:carboxylesterase type B
MARTLTVALATAMTLALTQVSAAQADDGPVVRTDKGAVRGTVTEAVRTFGGIPFAAEPIGENRWRDPRPVTPWNGVRDATTPAPRCAQTPQLGEPGSDVEDCLYLNVTTPAKSAVRPRPVMVWIHGGGFISGSASGYDARWLAKKNNAVVVTVNYRLGVFGYFGYPGLTGSGAFGLADQQAALRWVQRNIRAFGGNARDVTVLGESAGGLSVCAQLASPGAAGLFGKAVIQSGPCGLSVPDPAVPGGLQTFWKPREDVEKQGAGLRLGCPDLACLRALPVSRLLEVHGEFAQPAFRTRVLPIDPHVAQNTGRMHQVPTLVGSTHDEMTLYAGLLYPERIPDDGFAAKAAQVFGERLGAQVVARYPVNGNGDARDELAAALTDRSWSCPTHETRQRLGRRMPVAGYEFADPDVPMFFPGMPPFPGGYQAFHASELPLLFDFGVPLTAGQRELSDYMITAWGRFARTGDPGWRAEVQSLAAGAVGPADFSKDHQCEFWRAL